MRVKQICLLFLILVPLWVFANELTVGKKADIQKLMEITGSSKIGAQFASAITQAVANKLKANRPDIPERIFSTMNDELITFFKAEIEAPGGLSERVIPVYDKHFTHDEIKELLAFYQTAIGKKTIEVLPKIVTDSMVIGQKWGQNLGPEIDRRIDVILKKEGIDGLRK